MDDINHNINGSIPQYFAKKNVLITGSTGFMGKVLLQKLLSDCPEVGTLYLLIRNCKKFTAQEKLKRVLENVLFDRLKESNPFALKKLRIIEGDLSGINLGLSENNRLELIQNVNIVYHAAASVRFNMPLHEAIILNVRGTREVCSLVLEMKNLSAFLHVSTGFCHIDKGVIEEAVYPPKGSWREIIEIAERFDSNLLKVIQMKFMGNLPNSYTFTKSVSENLVVDVCGGKVPTIILRPTIVMPAYKGPVPGWTDSINGPSGILIGMNIGVIRALYIIDDVKYDYIPVDDTVNSMIKAVWLQQYLNNSVSVYNSSSSNLYEITPKTLMELGKDSMESIILKPFWHANLYTSPSQFMVYIHIILFHVFPLALVDLFRILMNKKNKYLRLQRKVYLAIQAYQYFLVNTWIFKNEKCLGLDQYLSEADTKTFCNDLQNIDYKEYYLTSARLSRELILKEDPKDEPVYKQRRILFKFIHVGLKYVFICFFVWLICRLYLN